MIGRSFTSRHEGGTLPLATALDAPSMNAVTDDERVDPLLGTSIHSGVPVEVTPSRLEGRGPG